MHKIIRQFGVYLRTNKKEIIQALVVALFFAACATFYYLGSAAGNCSTTLAVGPGDQTAGPIWLNSVVDKPLWGATDVTNAPYGENLRSPVLVTGALQYLLFWVATLFAGPVCGYNLYTALALVFSAMTVYLFVRSSTKRIELGIFAGFAAAFTPYLQSKTGVHPSYAFFGVFVLTIWLLVSMWQKPTAPKAIALGLIVSTFFYIDPYFMLLGGVTIGATLLALLVRLLYKAFQLRKQPIQLRLLLSNIKTLFTRLLLALGIVLVVGLAPLLAIRIKYSAQINAEVSSARSPIKQEARTYAARVPEYIWPATQNPYIGQLGGKVPELMQRKAHGSNAAENTLSISYIVAGLIGAIVVVWIASALRRKEIKLTNQERLLLGVLLLTATSAFIISLPPDFRGVPFPSGIITDYITVWRVFARLQVVVAFSLAIVAAISLGYFTRNLRRFTQIVIALLAIVFVGFEYLTFIPMSDARSWSYTQVHPFYYWLKNQENINAIAEYPLNEPGQTSVSVSYFTNQYIHKKQLINAARAASPQSVVRNSLRDISDPQVPGILAALGIDLVVIHAEDEKPIPSIPGLQELDWNKSTIDHDSIYFGGKLWAFKVTAVPDVDGLSLATGSGYNELRINSTYTNSESLFDSEAQLVVLDIASGGITGKDLSKQASFIASTTQAPADLRVSQNGVVLWQGKIDTTAREFRIPITTKHRLILENLGDVSDNKISISNLNLL